jgi:peptidoglycan/LPS O-acetylase OafA/YrhL
MNAITTYASLPSREPQIQHPEEPVHQTRNIPLGYLRVFITVLVVAHHALLAYHPYAPQPSASFTAPPMLWRAFPVVDSRRCAGADLFVGFNDIFFMALMFFVSGVFVWPALTRKGTGRFLRDRLVRLGVPFLVAAFLLGPLAYFPAFLQTGAKPSVAEFWHQWITLGSWPAGPAWFIWMLLCFDCAAALSFKLLPCWPQHLASIFTNAGQFPLRFFAILAVLSALAYVPMAFAFDPASWAVFGPFSLQTSRIFHYAVYFFAGIAIGANGIGHGLTSPDGRLARRWAWWLLCSLLAFGFCIVMLLATLASLTQGHSALGWKTLGNLGFVICCAASGLAFLGLFLRYARRPRSILDSLSNNAYGIYLIHYPIVSWLQYALLTSPISGAAKGCLVLSGALVMSWVVSASVRLIPRIARVV